MRTWKRPTWLNDQEGKRLTYMENGGEPPTFAYVKDYNGGFTRIAWSREGKLYDNHLFRIHTDGKSELILDKEELIHWLKYV